MGFSLVALESRLNSLYTGADGKREHGIAWLVNSSRTTVKEIHSCEDIGKGKYLVSFHGTPPMEYTVEEAQRSIYNVQYAVPTLIEQTPRKHVLSSIMEGKTLLVLCDGIFTVKSCRVENITISKADGTKENNVRCAKIVCPTKYGDRLMLYRVSKQGILEATLQHQTILAIYAKPMYDYVPDELVPTYKQYKSPLSAEVYKREYNWIVGMGESFAKVANAMANEAIVDTKMVAALQGVRDEHGKDMSVPSESKRAWALSRHVGNSTKPNSTTTVNKPVVVPKVATVKLEWLKPVLAELASKSTLPVKV